MLYLDLNGQRLHLRPGTSLNMELVSPLLADGIEDSHSMPLELPTAGNEIPLGHVHQLPLGNRVLSLPGAKAGHDGTPLHEGTLTVLASDKDTVRTTLSAEAFVVLMGETKLRTALASHIVNMVVQSGSVAAHFVAVNNLVKAMTPDAADNGWTHYFPLYFNPALYGPENPDWYPDAPDWDADKDYVVDDLVTYHNYSPVHTTRRYQCIADVPAGTPVTNTTYWKELAHGMVNAMDPVTGEPKPNTTDGNYYAIVPWWRLRHVVLKVLEYFGLEAAGDAFLEAGALGPKSMLTLGNNCAVDAQATNYRFRAAQNAAVTYVPGDDPTQFRLPAQDDTTAPNSDPSGVWSAISSQWTPAVAGIYAFVVHVEVNFPVAAKLRFRMRKADGTNVNLPWYTTNWYPYYGTEYITPNAATTHSRTILFRLGIGAPQLGNSYHFTVEGIASNGAVVWPALDTDTLQNCTIEGWLTEDGEVNAFGTIIRMADHVPDWGAAEFLDRVADTLNLEVSPDMENKVVHFNHRKNVLNDPAANTSYQPGRMLNTPELDHGRRRTGIAMQWAAEAGDLPDMRNIYRQEDVLLESDLAAPIGTQQAVMVRATRQLYVSRYVLVHGFIWEPRGYDVESALAGDANGAHQITPTFVPPHMAEKRLQGDQYLVPSIPEGGTSAFYSSKKTEGKAWLSVANGYSYGVNGTPYVTANSWGYAYSADAAQPVSMALRDAPVDDEAPGLWNLYHRPWWAMIVKAEAVTADLEMDHAFIRGKSWRRFLVMRNQTYLVERMPVVYGSAGGNLVSKGAYLLRIREPESPDNAPTTSFACAGPGYVPVFVGDGTGSLLFVASGGYFTVRSPDGSVDTFESNTQVDGLTTGAYCVWPSDAEGNKTGQFTVSSIGLGTIWFDLAGIEGMGPYEEIQILETVMATLTLPLVTGAPYLSIDASPMSIITFDPAQHFTGIYVTGAALLASTVDALIIAAYNSAVNGVTVTGVDLSGGTSSAPTAASAAAMAALADTYGVTVTTN